MSRKRRSVSKAHVSEAGIRSEPLMSEKSRGALIYVLIFLAAGIPFGLGKYFEFNSPGPFDSGAYVYSAKHILDGARIGVDEKPSAQIGTLLVNMLGVKLFGFSDTGPKFVQMLMQLSALILMFIVMRRLYGKGGAAIGVIIAAVYLSSPMIAKFGNVKEQYMIACMVLGVCCFVLYRELGKWWLGVLSGFFLIWAPLFKPTGLSGLGGVGFFVLLSLLLKDISLRQFFKDILLIAFGGVLCVGPLYIWIIGWSVQMELPYSSIFRFAAGLFTSGSAEGSGYVGKSREAFDLGKQFPIVMRYYGVMILPIAMSLFAVILKLWRVLGRKVKIVGSGDPGDRYVLLFAAWWLLDMIFVWISPRSYEQYYLPLNASAAMLAGYVVWRYMVNLSSGKVKAKWVVLGLGGIVCMIVMSWGIFFGIRTSPFSGQDYGQRQRGYSQKYSEISRFRKGQLSMPWQQVGEFIKLNSTPEDKIYVWGLSLIHI